MRHISTKMQDVLEVKGEYIHFIFSSNKHCIGGFICDNNGVIDIEKPLTAHQVAKKCAEIPLESLMPFLHEEGYDWKHRGNLYRFLFLGDTIFGVRVYGKRLLWGWKIIAEQPISMYMTVSFMQEWHEANQIFWSAGTGCSDSIFK